MALKFSIKDFFSPINIIQKSIEFNKNQWLTLEELERNQLQNLNKILLNAKENIPYYNEILKKYNFNLNPFEKLEDLSSIPVLLREHIRDNVEDLISTKVNLNKLSKVTTSGSKGEPLVLYMDKNANSLEFSFYLRFWGWHGYKLLDLFAELSAYSFRNNPRKLHYIFNRITNRLILNSLELSPSQVKKQYQLLLKYRPKFLKGSPSAIISFVHIAKDLQLPSMSFKAIFTSGEILTSKVRLEIENFFSCKVFDAYGHMERTFAASECEYQNLHINLDYGITRLQRIDDSQNQFKIFSTGLHNNAMPLIQYDVGDIIEYNENQTTCACGRNFPIIKRVLGRENDIIRLPNNKIITALYLVFDDLPEVQVGQIIQEDINNITIKIVPSSIWNSLSENKIVKALHRYLGNEIKIDVQILDSDSLLVIPGQKFKTIISKIS